jgi:hypothetical protein
MNTNTTKNLTDLELVSITAGGIAYENGCTPIFTKEIEVNGIKITIISI